MDVQFTYERYGDTLRAVARRSDGKFASLNVSEQQLQEGGDQFKQELEMRLRVLLDE